MMQCLRFINILFLLAVINISASDNSLNPDEMFHLGYDPIVYIINPLRRLFPELFSDKPDLIERFTKEINALPYSTRLKSKIEKVVLKILKSRIDVKFNLLQKYRNNNYDIFYHEIRAQVDFIDLASLLGITLDESTLSTSEINEYQRRHFPIFEGSIDNLQEVTENNYHLYNTWYSRFLENKANGVDDISIPEVKGVFDYLPVCFALYKKMFEDPVFEEFLKVRMRSVYPDSDNDEFLNQLKSYIQDRLNRFEAINSQNLTEGARKYSYFKLSEMDILWRNLIDIIFLCTDELIMYIQFKTFENKLRSNTEKFFQEGYFCLPGIGELSPTVFAINYGVPWLQFYDITLGIVNYDGIPNPNLISRRNHDNNHLFRIKNDYEELRIKNYYQHHNRKWIKIAFIRFLEFCKKISHEEYITIIPIMVHLIHELKVQNFPIFPNFMSILIREQSRENIEKFKLTSERIRELNEAWREVWEQLPLKKLEEK